VPAQILWANIVGGDLIGFSFAFEKKDPRVMERTPQEAKTLLTRRLFMLVSLLTVVSGVVATGLFYILIVLGTPLSEIRTVMFVVLSLDALFFSLSLKSLDTPLWRIPFLSNVSLVWALFISVSLLFLALFFAPLRSLLSLTSLTLFEGFLLVGVGLLNLTLIEGAKAIFFMRGTKHTVPIHATLHA
jgi:magnesium-transporting ATPase (P-type)